MVWREIEEFDLRKIAISGQCFRMGEIRENRFYVKARNHYLELEQDGNTLMFDCSEEVYETIWRDYFDLDTDYSAIRLSIDENDVYMTQAANLAAGMRILRQDLWEMLITFIISQQNNIPRIKKCVEAICTKYGEQLESGEVVYYGFPSAKVLSMATEEELRSLGLGYRAKYIKKTAEAVSSGTINIEDIRKMPYEEAKKALLLFHGVGKKVAECVCLYGLHHVDAFPIDTHIQQMLDKNYPQGFPFERYQGYSGILQQYGFFWELHGGKHEL